MSEKPLIGISSCLLGRNVRYDGSHQLSHYIADLLGKYVDFYPVCPEVECGLSTPREAMRLVQTEKGIQLQTQKTKQDITPTMLQWIKHKMPNLKQQPFCGFIFKAKSPSSGLFRIKIYGKNGYATRNGRGIFAQELTCALPFLPVEEDGRLHDSKLRENFIERIFCMHRWNHFCQSPKTKGKLMEFHAKHKYLLMAHSPAEQRKLGKMIADNDQQPIEQLYQNYFELLIPSLSKISTVKKNTNVLHHMIGYFKKDITREEKAELGEIVSNYHDHLVPLIVPITMINHYARKYDSDYLIKQYYLHPHPMELALRNHV